MVIKFACPCYGYNTFDYEFNGQKNLNVNKSPKLIE